MKPKIIILLPIVLLVIGCIGMVVWNAAKPDIRKRQNECKKVLRTFQSACKDHKVNYWAVYGTLLGAMREGDIIKWDDDVDVAMATDDFIAIEKRLPQYGLTVVSRIPFFKNIRKKRRFVKVVSSSSLSPLPLSNAIDVFLYDRVGDKLMTTTVDTACVREFELKDCMGDLKTVKFGPNTYVHVPHHAEKYLEARYGKDWMIPRRQESHYSMVQLIAALSFLIVAFLLVAAMHLVRGGRAIAA